jgi:DMSO/TMAO reductase YedYZ molybdopterin-dependent catalytic subunit
MNEGRFVTRGFVGRRQAGGGDVAARIPPGQYQTRDFPVLSAGPTPRTDLSTWTLTIDGLVRESVSWSWEEFTALPGREFVVDIHCVTKWTKLDTRWYGVGVDTLLEHVDLEPGARYVIAHSDGGYTTNLALPDVLEGRAFVGVRYHGAPLPPEHGGPARLVVPHLYFWKSAKWLRRLHVQADDRLGFWESLGYHERGDPFKEERYEGD